ncbi:hypothetical protein SAMN02910447_02674 [Ruminococcus sp. YE71]|uniref:hypothetical protein n=1 Tax=unclassified Ruminococcus TaxID=2608920 RepID=UPI00088A55AA|nr:MULTISPECIES: hypothetical protein [unclassified Ruminococcus]SDA26566.1 hypothetical protein SAMN02910446_02660 [Ruminococcus sp. YE78]SFW44242.1 hypothetical protein SAMN02910447_02674 [Ruminococcus sp. YE71]
MKNIRIYNAPKYSGSDYTEVEPNIYKTILHNDSEMSLALEQVTDPTVLSEVAELDGWKEGEGELYKDLLILTHNGKVYFKEIDDEEGIIFENMEEDTVAYVTSLVFEQEPQFGENAPDDDEISQYPLEDILDKFMCACCDDYPEENAADPINAYCEFESDSLDDIRSLLTIVGKHVYNVEKGDYVDLVIEDE